MIAYSLRLRLLLMFMFVVIVSMGIAQIFFAQHTTTDFQTYVHMLRVAGIYNKRSTCAYANGYSASCTHVPAAAAQVSETSAENFLISLQHSFWLAIVLAMLIALLLSLLCSNMILKPIKALTQTANHMARGDLNQRVKIRTKNEIGVLAHAFNTMADNLDRQEQLRRNLVSDVAHELRTPITNIRGYLEALQDQVFEPTPEIIASLYEESLLLSRLVADLQDLSHAENGYFCLVCRPLALEDVITKAVSACQSQAANKEITLNVDIPPHLPVIEADAERIGQVLRNLLHNAITHTPIAGKVTISARATRSKLYVSVEDTGEGIAAEHLPNLFERFYRADPSRSRATGGSGLGLAIVKQMVQAHGGTVTVDCESGRGACFTFTLPLCV